MGELKLKPPVLTLEDTGGREFTGTYVSHKKWGDGYWSQVVLERPNGARFRIITLTLALTLKLEEKKWTI